MKETIQCETQMKDYIIKCNKIMNIFIEHDSISYATVTLRKFKDEIECILFSKDDILSYLDRNNGIELVVHERKGLECNTYKVLYVKDGLFLPPSYVWEKFALGTLLRTILDHKDDEYKYINFAFAFRNMLNDIVIDESNINIYVYQLETLLKSIKSMSTILNDVDIELIETNIIKVTYTKKQTSTNLYFSKEERDYPNNILAKALMPIEMDKLKNQIYYKLQAKVDMSIVNKVNSIVKVKSSLPKFIIKHCIISAIDRIKKEIHKEVHIVGSDEGVRIASTRGTLTFAEQEITID